MGICAVHSQMHHTMGERVRLARSRPRNDKERTIGVASAFVDAVFDGTALINVELFKIGGGHRAGESLGWSTTSTNHVPCSFATDWSPASTGRHDLFAARRGLVRRSN